MNNRFNTLFYFLRTLGQKLQFFFTYILGYTFAYIKTFYRVIIKNIYLFRLINKFYSNIISDFKTNSICFKTLRRSSIKLMLVIDYYLSHLVLYNSIGVILIFISAYIAFNMYNSPFTIWGYSLHHCATIFFCVSLSHVLFFWALIQIKYLRDLLKESIGHEDFYKYVGNPGAEHLARIKVIFGGGTLAAGGIATFHFQYNQQENKAAIAFAEKRASNIAEFLVQQELNRQKYPQIKILTPSQVEDLYPKYKFSTENNQHPLQFLTTPLSNLISSMLGNSSNSVSTPAPGNQGPILNPDQVSSDISNLNREVQNINVNLGQVMEMVQSLTVANTNNNNSNN